MIDKEVYSCLDLSWTKIHHKGFSEKDLVATIPIDRLDESKRGEKNNLEAQCIFMWKQIINMIYDEVDGNFPPNFFALRKIWNVSVVFNLNLYFFIMQSVIYLLTSILLFNCSYWCSYGYQHKRDNPPP